MAEYYDAEYNEVKTYCITDRPVYRPEQKVKFKFWIRRASTTRRTTRSSPSRRSSSNSTIPRARRSRTGRCRADEYGGIEGSYDLPGDATLGQYQLSVVRICGGGSFRVEEYKKPEFEVTVEAPDRAGHARRKDHCQIKAKYYFGSPVTKAKVKYKVTAQRATRTTGIPSRPGTGSTAAATGGSATTTPGIPAGSTGAVATRPAAGGGRACRSRPKSSPNSEVPIGPDGTRRVEIDTARRQGNCTAIRTTSTRSRPKSSTSRGARSSARAGAGRAQAVQGLCLGRSRLLPRRRHDPGQLLGADARRQAGAGQRRC